MTKPIRDPIIYTGEPLPKWEIATTGSLTCTAAGPASLGHLLAPGAIFRRNNDLTIECCACAVAKTRKEAAA